MNINDLTLKQKISQMFITGFQGINYTDNCDFTNILKNGPGGVIFFTNNIETKEQFKNLIQSLSKEAPIPLFFSIDQEGGRVERTENIHGGKKYLSAKFAFEKGEEFLRNQTREIASELKSYGINMNFAPVLDVNTNDKNPIIGERAFSSNTDEVIKASKIVIEEYEKSGIITVGKHFPGHGDASKDSHKTLPVIDLTKEELETIHVKPFETAIKEGLPAVMAAHVLYPAFDDKVPASVSKKIINDLLIEKLGFKGIIITDDMEMNGIKTMNRLDACISAIEAGVSMFIFRDTTKEIVSLIDDLEKSVENDIIDINKIDSAVQKILDLKKRYGIIPVSGAISLS